VSRGADRPCAFLVVASGFSWLGVCGFWFCMVGVASFFICEVFAGLSVLGWRVVACSFGCELVASSGSCDFER